MRRFGLALAVAALMLACVPAAEASIYWHTSDDNIGRAEIGGTSPDYDFITGATYGGAATNGANLFWGNEGGVGRANLDGSGVNQNWWIPPSAACYRSPQTPVTCTGSLRVRRAGTSRACRRRG